MNCIVCNHEQITKHHIVSKVLLRQLPYKFYRNPTVSICRQCHTTYEKIRNQEYSIKHKQLNEYLKIIKTSSNISKIINTAHQICKLCNLNVLTDEDLDNGYILYKYFSQIQPHELLKYWCDHFCTTMKLPISGRELYIHFLLNGTLDVTPKTT